jgi:hypothetical protein
LEKLDLFEGEYLDTSWNKQNTVASWPSCHGSGSGSKSEAAKKMDGNMGLSEKWVPHSVPYETKNHRGRIQFTILRPKKLVPY